MKAAIIGASSESLHAIEEAKKLHIETVALDGNPKAEGLKAADKGMVVDISNEQATIEALEAEKPDFVLTVPIGRYLTTIGAVNDALDLPGISKNAAVRCTDKYEFHKALRNKNLRKCHCYLVNRDNLLLPENMNYPAILKPRYGSGSRGIHYVTNAVELTEVLVEVFQLDETNRDIRKAYEDKLTGTNWDEKVRLKYEQNEEIRRYLCECNREWKKEAERNKKEIDAQNQKAKNQDYKNKGLQPETITELNNQISGTDWLSKMKNDFAKQNTQKELTLEEKMQAAAEDYVLEDAVEGIEYGVDGAVEGCNFELVLLRKKLITPPPARQAVGYISMVPIEDKKLHDLVKEYMSAVVQALNLRDCMLHADLMIHNKNIFAIEVSARPSGHNLHNLFTPKATGIDMCKEYINYMCDNRHNFSPLDVRKMMIHYFDMENCFVHKVPKKEELNLPAGVELLAWKCNIKTLDYLEKVTTGHSIMGRGYYIVAAEKESLLLQAADCIRNAFEVT